MDGNNSPSSDKVQALIKDHYAWLGEIWTPDKESYPTHLGGFVRHSWQKAFAPFDNEYPRLASFFAEAAKAFAKNNLK